PWYWPPAVGFFAVSPGGSSSSLRGAKDVEALGRRDVDAAVNQDGSRGDGARREPQRKPIALERHGAEMIVGKEQETVRGHRCRYARGAFFLPEERSLSLDGRDSVRGC